MKTSLRRLAGASCVLLTLFAPHSWAQSITIERLNYFRQTGASSINASPNPVSLEFHIRGGATNMTSWGPAFYKPGSGTTPATGPSTATNTGTLNFSTSPNNGTDYMFIHRFASNADLLSFYPVAPTDGGVYGIQFQGAGAPTPSTFTAGLTFAGGTFPSVSPQITAVNNGAIWSSGLRINPIGITTLQLNTFPEYSSTTYGALIGVGIYSNNGQVVQAASLESYYIPTIPNGQQPAITQLTIDGSWLTPGVDYTLELQYGVLGSAPAEGFPNGINFQGLAAYYSNTTISVKVKQEASLSDFNGDGNSDLLWRNKDTGQIAVWYMNGSTYTGSATVGTLGSIWVKAGSGDFDHDGQVDLVWRNTSSGEVLVWLMSGITQSSTHSLGAVSLDWKSIGTGDFNHDNNTDLLWRNTSTGEVAVWFMDGVTFAGSATLGEVSLGWAAVGTGDFNQDGHTDLLWRNIASGEVAVWFLDRHLFAGSISFGTVGLDWQSVGTGDFNQDGHTDLIWRSASSGQVAVWYMDRSTFAGSVSLGTIALTWESINN